MNPVEMVGPAGRVVVPKAEEQIYRGRGYITLAEHLAAVRGPVGDSAEAEGD